jgi:hypothetical protein
MISQPDAHNRKRRIEELRSVPLNTCRTTSTACYTEIVGS